MTARNLSSYCYDFFNDFRYRLIPKMMVDVSNRNMKTTVLGNEVSMPIGIAPTAMQRMAHQDGECATAKAAQGDFKSITIVYILIAF